MTKKMISLILAILIICASVPLTAVQAFALDLPPATGFENAEPIALGETKKLIFEDRGKTVLLKFTAPEDGEYVLRVDQYIDHKIAVYDQNYWNYSTKFGYGQNTLVNPLKAGETVYFDCGFPNGSFSGYINVGGSYTYSYSVTMLACPKATGMHWKSFIKELNRKTGDKDNGVNIEFEPDYAKAEDVFWTSDDPDIVEINRWGRYECKAAGSTVLRAHTESGLECSIPINVTDYEVFAPGETKTVVYDHNARIPKYLIVPEKSGMYTFKSDSESRIHAWINDENKNSVASVDTENFNLSCYLEAGKKYYFSANLFRGDGTFDVTAEYNAVYITGIEVLSPPNNTNPDFERFDEFPECEGLKLRTTWSDGQTVDWTYGTDGLEIRGYELNLRYDQDYVFGEDTVDIFIVATCGGMSTQIKLEPTPVPKKIDLGEYNVNEQEFLNAADGERMIADIDLTGKDYDRFFNEMGIAPESFGKSLIFNDMYTLTNENNIKMCLTKAQIYKAAELDCVENLGVSPDPDNWSTLQCTKGDVNGDKSLDITDAVNIQRYAVDKTKFSATQENLGDFNNDGKCDALDSTAIQRALVSE